ncbi:MAG: hypothetical protein ABJO27_27980 [Pseudoruegeria sp.]
MNDEVNTGVSNDTSHLLGGQSQTNSILNLGNSLGSMLDGTAGELGGGPKGMLGEVGENTNGTGAQQVDGVLDGLEIQGNILTESQHNTLSHGTYQSLHEQTINALNSNDPARQQCGEEAKNHLINLGEWNPELYFPPDGVPPGGPSGDASPDSPFVCPPSSPLILDLDGDGIELTALENSNVHFDLNVD